MRQSQKAVLAVIGSLATIIVILVAYTNSLISETDISLLDQQDRIFIAQDLNNFNSVNASGAWQVEIVQGETWSVETNSLDDYKGKVTIHVSNDTLILKHSSFVMNNYDLIAKVRMPELNSLELSGAVEARMSGFSGSILKVDASGAVDLDAESGDYDKLVLDTSGAAEINFKNITVTDADVDLSGATEVTLRINGGELNGSISGAGSIDYYGNVSSQSINISGAGEIRHND